MVGIGKTFLVSRIARAIMRKQVDDCGYRMIPVYACLESFVASHGNGDDSPEFVRLFLLHFFDLIRKAIQQFAGDTKAGRGLQPRPERLKTAPTHKT